MAVRIILVGTTHPGNIGAVARAMKNMGLHDLVLVNPRSFPHEDATARASGAEDILEDTRVVESLDAALADCVYAAGASARTRAIDWPSIQPRECAERLVRESAAGNVAVVFGPEKSGLTNEDLDRCSTLLTIPTDPNFSSLNIAMAVQIICYELRLLQQDEPDVSEPESPPATAEELEHFYRHLETVLTDSGFLDPDKPRLLMRRLRRLFIKAEPDKNEINILRGILNALEPAIRWRQVSDKTVYLDYAATTPAHPRVAEAMLACLSKGGSFANPASVHVEGRRSAVVVADARARLAGLLNASPDCLTWTSGATESNNLAIQGAANARAHRGRHLVTMRTEHKAVVDTFKALEKNGFEVSWLSPNAEGILDIDTLVAALRDDTQLVSVMHVNNETGVIQDINRIGTLCREREILFHTDAAQSVGKLDIDLENLPVDLLSLTAHKFYGPQGIGALFIADRPGVGITPITYGGGQERRLRPGTLPVHLIAGIGMAAGLVAAEMHRNEQHYRLMRDRLWAGIADIGGVIRNGSVEDSFAGILNVSAEGVEGESLMLGMEPVCVASGSACNSTSGESSYVLRALGRDDRLAQSAVRFSFGADTTAGEIDIAIQRYRQTVAQLRKMAPAQAAS